MDELAYERRLRRAGLPLLIEDHSAWEDIFIRAVPLLSLVLTGELLGAVGKDWPLWTDALALFIAVGSAFIGARYLRERAAAAS